ncbi:MAG: Crp/Fnr family transcriptional regulator [Bacteroidales bacterium]
MDSLLPFKQGLAEKIRKRLPFLEETLITELAYAATAREVEAGDSLLGEGDYIKWVPLVLDGSLTVTRNGENGGEFLLYYINPGELCSMSLTCCMRLQKSSIVIVADTDATVLMIPVDRLEAWMMKFRSWKEYMMYSYRQRFEELVSTIDALAFMNMEERVERFFRERYSATGSFIYTGKHQDIAGSLNSSREVISRILKRMENDGIIKLGRNRIDFSGLVNRD